MTESNATPAASGGEKKGGATPASALTAMLAMACRVRLTGIIVERRVFSGGGKDGKSAWAFYSVTVQVMGGKYEVDMTEAQQGQFAEGQLVQIDATLEEFRDKLKIKYLSHKAVDPAALFQS